jgi:hypothetical protein
MAILKNFLRPFLVAILLASCQWRNSGESSDNSDYKSAASNFLLNDSQIDQEKKSAMAGDKKSITRLINFYLYTKNIVTDSESRKNLIFWLGRASDMGIVEHNVTLLYVVVDGDINCSEVNKFADRISDDVKLKYIVEENKFVRDCIARRW